MGREGVGVGEEERKMGDRSWGKIEAGREKGMVGLEASGKGGVGCWGRVQADRAWGLKGGRGRQGREERGDSHKTETNASLLAPTDSAASIPIHQAFCEGGNPKGS